MFLRTKLLTALLFFVLVSIGCTTTEQVAVNADRGDVVFGIRHTGEARLGDRVTQLPGIGEKAEPIVGPRPVAVEIDAIGLNEAGVIAVGVDDRGSFDVPNHNDIGWYKYGPSPGEFGSAVLAAHVVLNGTDGAFRNLAELKNGDEVKVFFDDGSEQEFTILAMEQYAKSELPVREIFRRDGEPQLTLVTCGGDYNPATNGYDDNIVAIALPV